MADNMGERNESPAANDAPVLVPREVTQAKLDLRSVAAARCRASQTEGIAERLEATVRKHGARDALIYGGERVSYAELERQVNRVAHALHAQGVRRGDVVAMCLENRPAFFYVWLGLAKLSAVAAFLNTNVRGRPLAHALEATGATRVVVGEECLGLFEDLQTSLPLWLWPDEERAATQPQRELCELSLEAVARHAPDSAPPASWRDGLVASMPAIYIFTSGTTGLPKAAIVSHGRWLITGDVMQISIGLGPDDCFYTFLPLYHGAASLSAAATAITAGASLLLRRKFSRRAFWDDVRRYRVTTCQYVGEICRFLLTEPERSDDKEHTLRILLGTGLAPEIWEQWVRRFGPMDIFESWGATESNTNVLNVDNRVGSCGRIPFWEKTNLRLVRYDLESGTYPRGPDGFMQLAGVNEPGEAIGMIIDLPDMLAGRFEGYTSAEATERKILRNVFREGDAWWASGDLLRCDADGYCWFVDRIGDTFRWNSENVSTAEVTDQLGDFPGMETLTVYGVQVPGHEGRAGMAAVVMQPDHAFDPAAFWALGMQRLPRYAAPLFVRVAAAADMTGNYKLRKVDLQREGYDATQITDPLYLRDDAAGTYVALTPEALRRVLRV
ncbi:long-chain-acyl-CoA synthetase [Rhodanobacter glycinis]|uniref:Long-chain-acyl-CoA synthetase n=2 Tax=Rhodanobacter glycinis TaxID=582702 RepID=A0A5B9DW94_9GAMM|nr:long-chain-acyl-CoA synthetase [Rhodanobacter glycinis]